MCNGVQNHTLSCRPLQRLMTAFLEKLFTIKSFEADFPLISNMDGVKGRDIKMPDGIRYVLYSLSFCTQVVTLTLDFRVHMYNPVSMAPMDCFH